MFEFKIDKEKLMYVFKRHSPIVKIGSFEDYVKVVASDNLKFYDDTYDMIADTKTDRYNIECKFELFAINHYTFQVEAHFIIHKGVKNSINNIVYEFRTIDILADYVYNK